MQNKRLLSLDILRGITVAGMILVNNGWGLSFDMLGHCKWNGMTPCDLVFPFFLFIMGISCYLSLVKSEFKPTSKVIRRIIKRTVLLFAIGLFINWFDHAIEGDLLCFGHLRIWAVMQRIALCYGIVSLFALFCNHKYTVPVIIGLLAVYAAILVFGNGYVYDADVNVLARVDRSLFGVDHLYQKSPVDPEGLVGTISSVAHTLLGFYCGVSCGLATLLQAVLMYVIDLSGSKLFTIHYSLLTFFRVFGVNALALYVSSELLAIILGNIGVSEVVYGWIHAIVSPLKLASLTYALYFVLLNFAIGYVLYRKKIYIKL